MKELLAFTVSVSVVGLMLYLAFKLGIVESPKKTRDRKNLKHAQEAEEFANMTPEVQQLHISAQNKIAIAKQSFIMLVINTIFSIILLYWIL